MDGEMAGTGRSRIDRGELGTLVRALDWAATPLGPADRWPRSLRTAVDLVLASPLPMIVLWGPDLVQVYNDAFAPICGPRHPRALGRPARDCWPEAWDAVAPVCEAVRRGERRLLARQPLVLPRAGRDEAAWFDLACSPVPDDGDGVGGVLVAAVDVSHAVRTERGLRDLDARRRFRASLDAVLRPIDEPVAALAAASEALGRHLGVGQVAYAEVDPSGRYADIPEDWNDGTIPSNAGRHEIASYGRLLDDLRAGRTVAVADVRTDPRTAAAAATFAGRSVAAFVDVPLVKAGRLEGVLAVHHRAPRDWTDAELAAIQETAERTWDAVERARAEQALTGSLGRLSTIFSRAAVGLSELTADGRFLEANAELGRIVGRSRDELLGLSIADVTHPEDLAHSVATVQEALRTGTAKTLDKRYTRPDGSWVWAQSTVSRVEGEDGEPRILAVTADLSARREAEERLRGSEARFRTLAQTLPQLVWRAADWGRWTWASQRWADFTGQSDAQAMDRGWLDAVHPDDRGAVLAAWERAETTDHLEAEVRIRRHDGWYGWFQVEARPVEGTRGRAAEWCGACSDITVMKALEAELRAGREEAERARAAAEAADAAKTRFLGAVSHDLRQPVMAATLMADLLARRNGDAPEVLDHLRDALGNLSGMLNGLLESARIEAGLVRPEVRTFPLDDVLRRLQSEFEPVARDAGLRLRVASARWDVSSDPLLLELMLRNLLSNAIRFTDAGGVTVEARSLGDAVEVTVADTGRGIPADQIHRIFDDFHQLGDPGAGRTRGFGIGLSTVRRVADVLGAGLDVRSEPGRGSVFAVRLPAAAGDVFAGRIALVVDDDWLVLKGLEMSLEDMGLRVHAARTVREAEQVLAGLDGPVAVVVADYTLTGGEVGTEVIAAVRRRDPQAAAILLTGDTSPLRLAEAEGSGYRLVHKPVDPRRLREILASVLREA